MTTTNDIENIFMLATSICAKCRGSRSVSNEDGSYSPCTCVIKEMILKYIGELKKYKTLTETTLLETLKAERDTFIEFDESWVLYSHLKTALLQRKNWLKTWTIITPDELMSRSFSKEEDQRHVLYKTDLLIVMASAFPFYEAAGRQHEYVIKTRRSLGKTTWFCTSNKALFEKQELKSITSDFKKMLMSFKQAQVNLASTRKLLKKKKVVQLTETSLELGSSLSEVEKDYLLSEDPIGIRLTQR